MVSWSDSAWLDRRLESQLWASSATTCGYLEVLWGEDLQVCIRLAVFSNLTKLAELRMCVNFEGGWFVLMFRVSDPIPRWDWRLGTRLQVNSPTSGSGSIHIRWQLRSSVIQRVVYCKLGAIFAKEGWIRKWTLQLHCCYCCQQLLRCRRNLKVLNINFSQSLSSHKACQHTL